MPTATSPTRDPSLAWRTPFLVVACGALLSLLTFGPRSAMGIFISPISAEGGWGREVFSLAFALQNLCWGIGAPFSGALADRFGATRVLIAGLVLYAAGLAAMTAATDPATLQVSSGVLIGFGLAGASFNVVLAAFGKILPPAQRPMAYGLGTAAGSLGQFLFTPLAVALIGSVGWRGALLTFAAMILAALPLAFVLRTPANAERPAAGLTVAAPRSARGVLRAALAHPSYVLLVLGFFTCGFHLAFITLHLPAYLLDKGLTLEIGGYTLAAIGLANMVGSLSAGWLMQRMPRRWLLAGIYALRSVIILAFITLPVTPASAILFGAGMGLLWLSTVPPTSGLVALMFGTRDMAMLYGFAFFSHQVGGFLGAWLGGVAYARTGSYDVVWWVSIALGVASAAINLPIRERPATADAAAQPA